MRPAASAVIRESRHSAQTIAASERFARRSRSGDVARAKYCQALCSGSSIFRCPRSGRSLARNGSPRRRFTSRASARVCVPLWPSTTPPLRFARTIPRSAARSRGHDARDPLRRRSHSAARSRAFARGTARALELARASTPPALSSRMCSSPPSPGAHARRAPRAGGVTARSGWKPDPPRAGGVDSALGVEARSAARWPRDSALEVEARSAARWRDACASGAQGEPPTEARAHDLCERRDHHAPDRGTCARPLRTP